MHDPKVVAWVIVRPWPRVRRHRRDRGRWIELRHRHAKWYQPWSGWRRFSKVGSFELYWPGLLTFWHNEPNGHDSGEVCKHHVRRQDDAGKWHSKPKRGWKFHVHHMSVQVHPWQSFRRWAFTRCEWCGGKSRKGDSVNISHQWDREPGPWWRGERGLFHQDCSSVESAHRTCICRVGPWSSGPLAGYAYGRCANCGKFRPWKSEERRDDPGEITTPLLASIPAGQRDPDKTALARTLWREHQDAKRGAS